MPKPNYAYEKRQRELEKKRKKEDKAQKKATAAQPPGTPQEGGAQAGEPATTADAASSD
jgi:hypothetical protein